MPDAAIVGGGIGGAALALALTRGGRKSVVLERAAAPPRAGRPEILWPATLDALDRLGVGDEIRDVAAVPLTAIEIRAAGASVAADGPPALLRLGDGTLRHATDPNETRAAILRAAEATGRVEIRRGFEAREIVVAADEVRVVGVCGGIETDVRAAFVAGDDGAKSRVRGALGIGLTTAVFPAEFAGTDVDAASIPRGIGSAWVDPDGVRSGVFAAICIPLPRGRAALVCVLAPGTWDGLVAAGPAAFAARMARLAPPVAALFAAPAFPGDFVHVLRPVGHADRYVAARGAILGDAAHPMSPAGGQGANAAIADAIALADVLLARLATGDLSAAALAPYEAARRPANERSLAFSRRAAKGLRALRAVPALRHVAGAAAAVVRRAPPLRRRIVEAFATAYIGAPVRITR